MVKVELEQSMIRTMWRFCWIPKGVWYTNSSGIVGELKQWSSLSQNISWHPANEKETETVRRDVKAGTSFCVRYCLACNSLRVGSWKWAGSFLVSNNNRAIDLILAATLTCDIALFLQYIQQYTAGKQRNWVRYNRNYTCRKPFHWEQGQICHKDENRQK